MRYRWNDADSRQPKYWVKNMSQCEGPHRQLTNPGLRGEILANNRLSDVTTLDAMQSGIDCCQCFGATRYHRVQDRQRYATMVFWVKPYILVGWRRHYSRHPASIFVPEGLCQV